MFYKASLSSYRSLVTQTVCSKVVKRFVIKLTLALPFRIGRGPVSSPHSLRFFFFFLAGREKIFPPFGSTCLLYERLSVTQLHSFNDETFTLMLGIICSARRKGCCACGPWPFGAAATLTRNHFKTIIGISTRERKIYRHQLFRIRENMHP